MKGFAFGFCALTISLLTFPAATSQRLRPSDEEAVRGTVADYIEGYYTGGCQPRGEIAASPLPETYDHHWS